MTHQIITVQRAYLLKFTVRVFIQDVDAAVEFASWLQQVGFTVEMSEGPAVPLPALEDAAAAALVEMYARARA